MEQVANTIHLRGSLLSLPRFSHENHGTRFFRLLLDVPRLSGAVDTLPVIVEEGILNTADLHRAFNAGAKFAVAPGFNPTVVKEAIANEWAFAPGVCTPSEAEQAMELGCRFLKFFPAEAAGGVKMIQSLIAPYKHLGIRFMPTGGVTTANVANYLAVKEIVAVGGTWLGKSADIEAGNWDAIRTAVKDAVALKKSL